MLGNQTMATVNRVSIERLGGAFEYFIGYEHGAVTPSYFWFRKRQRVLRLIERHFQNLGPCDPFSWRAAELGCGDGVDFYLIRKKIIELSSGASLHLTGVDGNPDSLWMCELKKAFYGASDSDFVRCDLSQSPLPFGDSEFDFLYCSEVLEHLPRPEILLTEVRRILKPRGYFLITTPNEPNIFQRSYWDRRRRETQREKALRSPVQVRAENGKPLPLFGHVSIRPIADWDICIARLGFEQIDFERGAIAYEMPHPLRGEFLTGLLFCLEAALDALPKSWVRALSDQMIALYRKLS